ncbi:MAG: class I SAM-dependent RNA methyltransferase [Alphaproteobacteria bacterium]|nr:class I SAM-dependent RNA methyltransferase [Alphaproteobacteria bacterium]MBF0250183.1 class I SAM-dependent RNA methyltransferase [Alphaproteobacteria bacterium]
METASEFEIFLVTAPGLEDLLCAEAAEQGFRNPRAEPGGVTVAGGWAEVRRANLTLRGASRVLARLGAFPVHHLAQLDKRARRFPWAETFRPDVPVRIEATCRGSRIYHAGAAAERIERAIHDALGAPIAKDAPIRILARIHKDVCTISVDASGALLHKRGHKEAVNKAPLRENLAALFLRQCGYTGTEPVVDPMCGSGTFVIEAAEIAAGLHPGRTRAFAFELLAGFDAGAWTATRAALPAPVPPVHRFTGFDRDAGAVRMSLANAARAGVAEWTDFHQQTIGKLVPPEGPPGLVIVNPPYGARIGEVKKLRALHQSLGRVLMDHFAGWRVGLITNTDDLARATALPFATVSGPVSHGGIRVNVYATAPLP